MHIPYTILRQDTYHYNRRVYSDTLRFSLKTKCKHEALHRVVNINKVVDKMRIEKTKLEDIRKAAQVWLKRNLDIAIVREATSQPLDNPEAEEQQNVLNKDYENALTQAKEIIADREHMAVHRWDSEQLSQEFTLGLSDDEIKVLSYYIAQANVIFHQKLASRELVELSDLSSHSISKISDKEQGRTLSELIEEYIHECERELAPKTIVNYQTSLAILLELVGDMTISTFTRSIAKKLMDKLYDYPLNRLKGSNKEKSLEEIKAGNWCRISSTTIKNHWTS